MNAANSTQHKNSNLFPANSIAMSAMIVMIIATGLFLVTAHSTAKNQGSNSPSPSSFPAVTVLGDPVGSPAEVLGEPYHFDHTVVNKQGLPNELNASPITIAASE